MKNKEWFESWFDTEYYHILYRDRNHSEAEKFITHLSSHLNLPSGAKILDLACGKGRHSLTLSKLGYNVLGADLSSESIQSASKYSNDCLRFKVHDMRESLGNELFDAVFNLFTSFGYFDDHEQNREVIRSVWEMLKPGGLFIIDFMNTVKVVRSLVETETKTVDSIEFNIKRRYEDHHIYKQITFSDKGETHAYTERVQALKLDDFESMLSDHGFDILSTFGDFELNSFDPDTSDRLILVAFKK